MKINRKFSALVIFMVMFFVVLLPLKNVSAQQSNDKLVPSQSIKTINEKESNQQITDNIFTQVKMFRTNGVEIKTSDIIPNGSPLKVSFQFSFTNKNYKKGDYFKTKIPQQINIASDLEGDFNPMTSAKWTIDAATNELTILFVEDNVKSETYDLDIVTALKKVNTSNESETKIIFDTTPQNTIYKLEYTSTIEDRGTSKIKVDGTFNQKTAQIESVYNLGRIIDNDRSFDVAIQMSGAQELWFSNLKVATSEVNFNGQLEGEKTQLQEGVDYDVTYVDINSNYPHAKVKLKKPLDRKALIINSQINNINNKNYSSPNNLDYGVIYAYARTMSGNTILTNIINSDYVYSGQPVMNSGKLNKETGNIDWTIYWNHNERDLNTTTFLRSFIGDQGLSYSENSLSINKVEVTRTSNGYSISEGSDITSQFNINMDTKGSFFMNPKSNISDALVIKYSTKNNDATKRDVTNAVTDGQNESEATVSTKPNLFEKENAEVDLYEQTMSWKITINKDRYNLKNAYVHDYFIDDVVDFTSLEVNKKSNGEEVVKLEEGKDYKLVVFDENGNPVGAKPNVNGAPDSFNGGVKVSFIGDYANLKDTLEININTKLDTKDFEKQIVKIKNVATLNYGDIPGVIVYEAEGDYNNPYYQGGAKLVKSSSDKQYYYQNWLIAVNVSGIKYNKVIIEDALPPGLELVSGSLRYDEIVSSEMLDKINNYIQTDNKLAVVGDDAYPTTNDSTKDKVKLEFDNLKKKKVFVKFKTRTPKKWFINRDYVNKAEVSFDGKVKEFEAKANTYEINRALTKSVHKDTTKNNVARWTIQTQNISEYLPVENPVIEDTLKTNMTNTRYDATSFEIFDLKNNKKIDTKYYDLDIKDESYKITFKDYTATDNLEIIYRTVSEYPGTISNKAEIKSPSYGDLYETYRQGYDDVTLSFTSGSGTGIEKTGGFEIEKVDASDNDKKLEGAIFEILKADGTQTGLKATTDSTGKATFNNITYGDYLLKESSAPDKYLISEEYKNGKAITIDSPLDQKKYVVENSLAPTYADVKLIKKDSKNNKLLQGATFKLVNENNKVIASNLKTNNKGVIDYKKLISGTYSFIETKAPVGYKLNTTPVHFTLIPGQTNVQIVEVFNEQRPKGQVDIHFVDTKNNKIAKSQTMNGYVGDKFKANPKKIKGYKLIKSTKQDGIYKDKKQEVIYTYKKEESNKGKDKEKDKISKTGTSTTIISILLATTGIMSLAYYNLRKED